jgi:hypothetical protein
MRCSGKLLMISILILFLALTMSVGAEEENMEDLPDGGVNYECKTCHTSSLGGESLNPFGKDFGDNNFTWNDRLGRKDSDKDGFSNSQELENDPVTNPGDPESFPDSPVNMNLILIVVVVVVVIIIGLAVILKFG